MGWNTPDDWGCYYRTCECGARYHLSEGGCDCDCDGEEEDPQIDSFEDSLLGGKVVQRARKAHVCDGCLGPIYAKDTYYRGIVELDPTWIKTTWDDDNKPVHTTVETEGSLIRTIKLHVDCAGHSGVNIEAGRIW